MSIQPSPDPDETPQHRWERRRERAYAVYRLTMQIAQKTLAAELAHADDELRGTPKDES